MLFVYITLFFLHRYILKILILHHIEELLYSIKSIVNFLLYFQYYYLAIITIFRENNVNLEKCKKSLIGRQLIPMLSIKNIVIGKCRHCC